MKFSTDGYLDLRDSRRVRTPGYYIEQDVEPTPEGEALAFLFSHSFPGHRRVVRTLTVTDRKRLHMAVWADSVSERMALVDRVWRSITEPVAPPDSWERPHLIQVVTYGEDWAYPLYLDGSVTRVLPLGGIPRPEAERLEATRTELTRSA